MTARAVAPLILAAAVLATAPHAASQSAARAPAAAVLTADETALVNRAAAYLETLDQASGRFVQTDARGAVSEGRYWIKRPGKMRFAYDKGLLVVSDGANVKLYDPRLRTFDQYPLSQTPLSVFLAKSVRLDRGVRVDRVTRTADGFQIVARDARRPAEGSLTLVFADGPTLRLKEWTVADAQGSRTRVQLSTLERASGLAADLFVLRDPTRRPGRS